jgi:bacterioferritin-associated ferredoxin
LIIILNFRFSSFGGSAVIVCICRRLNDHAIAAAIDDGAATPEALGERCGAGTVCGGCTPELARMCDERTACSTPCTVDPRKLAA